MRHLLIAFALTAFNASGAAQVVLYETNFDTGAGWTYVVSFCGWNVDALPAGMQGGAFRTPPNSLNCNSDTFGYATCFNRVADSPPIDLTPAAGFGATLSFWCNYDIEEDDCTWDTRHLQASNNGFQSLVMDICYRFSDCGPAGVWHEHQVPVLPAWGVIQLRYFFDAHDGLFCNECHDGWFVDDLLVGTGCPAVVPYCTAKVNSQGCTPVLSTVGTPSATGTSAFRLLAGQVLSQQPGVLIWSLGAGATPYGGGTLCVAPPVQRTPAQLAGGNPPPLDCTGSYSFQMTPTLMAMHGLVPGTLVYAQYWSRDPGFPAPGDVGLTAAVYFQICP